MTRIRRGVAALAVTALLGVGAAGCGTGGADAHREEPQPAAQPDAGVPDTPDAGKPDAGPPDAGPSAGPWPNEPVLNYSQKYALGGGIKSLGVDDGHNLWLLDGERIGVLRPGDTQPKWSYRVGQAQNGFGHDQLALGSTVICGGKAGEAFVGYMTYELSPDPKYPGLHFAYLVGAGESCSTPPASETCYPFDAARWEERKRGDLDIVRLQDDGTVKLHEHLSRTIGESKNREQLGLTNTNDYHFDEDRTVFSCRKVLRGPFKGDVFVGTNHGATRISDTPASHDPSDNYWFNSHIHPTTAGGNNGYVWALGMSYDGQDVLVGNLWKIGIYRVPTDLRQFDRDLDQHWRLNTPVGPGNGEDDVRDEAGNVVVNAKDYWRGFEQTKDGAYYLGSEQYGLYRVDTSPRSDAPELKLAWRQTKIDVGSERIHALAATDDGSLFIGTEDRGLWRLKPDRSLEKVSQVSGTYVRQLLYDPTVAPAMLYVLTDAGLTVLRGY